MENKSAALEAYLSSRSSQGASRLGELMVKNQLIDGNQLQEAYTRMRTEGTSFLNSLLEMGAIKDEDVHTVLSEHFKVPAIKLSDLELDQDIVSLVPEETSLKHKVIPINRTGATLVVAMSDPSNIETVDELKFLTGLNIDVVVATENEIKEAIERYHDSAEMLEDVMASFDDSDIEMGDYEEDFDLATVETDSESAPVVKLVNQILHDALGKGASDVHFEPYENAFRVRYRIDGVLYHILSPPYKLRNAIVSRIKILAKLNIAERRLPQDGRVSVKMKGKKIDFRVSTLPTLWGEKMVMRILDKESLQLDLTKLGMLQPQLNDFRWAFKQPYGMVLVTGPSGSGKTTTLYSALIELNKISDNVSTAEDPIEYYMEGINQVQMHDDIGLNFAYALRSFLRQDPDVIMVGEIRDFETAEIAVKAALTGHIVLSTVHTNDAPSTINRLLNMGVEPFLITASMNGILSQRLVRRLCDHCKEPEELDRKALLQVGVPEEEIDDFVAYTAVGCPQCVDRGFKGRVGIYEVLTVKGEIADLILNGATPTELKHEAMGQGMLTLRQAGLQKVRDGVTTLEEITRTTMPDFMSGESVPEE
ncbi:MAG: type IV-A pilus assembly ATPase PilB [bacterium]